MTNLKLQGTSEFSEFKVGDVSNGQFYPRKTASGKSYISVFIKFEREIGFMITTYLQVFVMICKRSKTNLLM